MRSPILLAGLAFVAVGLVRARFGPEVGLWCAVGLAGTAGYLWGTWLGIRMAGGVAAKGGGGSAAGLVLGLVLLLKVPPIVLLALASRDARPEVRDGLLYGVAVVYSWLVAWGLLPLDARATPPDSPSP